MRLRFPGGCTQGSPERLFDSAYISADFDATVAFFDIFDDFYPLSRKLRERHASPHVVIPNFRRYKSGLYSDYGL